MIKCSPVICSIALVVSGLLPAFGQTETAPDWYLQDPETNRVQGISLDKAYTTLLTGRPSKTVVVAIIDSGVDIDHEDLKRVVWTNKDEVPANGIDDDRNGYIDDIHGWNFIGGKEGNVNEDTYELTREYVRLEKRFGGIPEDKVGRKEKKEYENYKKIKDKYTRLRDKNKEEYAYYSGLNRNLRMSVDTLKAVMKADKLTREGVDTFKTSNPTLAFAKGFIASILRRMGPDSDIEVLQKELQDGTDYYRVIVEYGYNPEFDSRQIVGDSYTNPREKNYGNNNVKGPDPKHGTHVAGIIAGDRTNGLGIKGIADNVSIMSVRAVPNGDERDKDIANAIRYAVDNGAKVINMSFGKSFSPEKAVVDEAVAYAEKRGVLLVHAAGNENDDNDKEPNYPNRRYLSGKDASNWLEIGASGVGTDKGFVASFSNYGKKTVDLFAPGMEIYSTTPENTYERESGTSMASPVAAGVAALLWSYFPDLTVAELVDILRNSTRKFDGLKVQKPGGGDAAFSDLSSTGGLLNAYEAISMAISLKATALEKR